MWIQLGGGGGGGGGGGRGGGGGGGLWGTVGLQRGTTRVRCTPNLFSPLRGNHFVTPFETCLNLFYTEMDVSECVCNDA